jgi:hypothetical protein
MELGFSFERRIDSHIIACSASLARINAKENLLHAQFGDKAALFEDPWTVPAVRELGLGTPRSGSCFILTSSRNLPSRTCSNNQ